MDNHLYLVALFMLITFCLGAMAGVVLVTGSIAHSCDLHGKFKNLEREVYICERKTSISIYRQ